MKQSLRRQTNTVFRNYAKDDELGARIQSLDKFRRMPAFKDVERLLFKEDLLVLRKIMWQRRRGLIRDNEHMLSQRFLDKIGARGSFYTMGRKNLELGIILRVVATMGDEKNQAVAGCICKLSDIRKQSFSPRHVELSAGQQEISLRIDFPENQIAR